MTKYIPCAQINPVQGCEGCPLNCLECEYFGGIDSDWYKQNELEIICDNPNR